MVTQVEGSHVDRMYKNGEMFHISEEVRGEGR
jgi:hypothetical protein